MSVHSSGRAQCAGRVVSSALGSVAAVSGALREESILVGHQSPKLVASQTKKEVLRFSLTCACRILALARILFQQLFV